MRTNADCRNKRPRFFMRAITKIRPQSARALKKMTAGKGGKPAVIKSFAVTLCLYKHDKT